MSHLSGGFFCWHSHFEMRDAFEKYKAGNARSSAERIRSTAGNLKSFHLSKKFVKLVEHDRYKNMSRLRSTWQPIEKTFQEKRHAELVSASHAN